MLLSLSPEEIKQIKEFEAVKNKIISDYSISLTIATNDIYTLEKKVYTQDVIVNNLYKQLNNEKKLSRIEKYKVFLAGSAFGAGIIIVLRLILN